MKILISLFVVMSFVLAAVPLEAKECKWNLPWNKACRKEKIEKESDGTYSPTQRDYHIRKSETDESKKKPGYYGGKYHNKGSSYRKQEYQFVDDAH